MSDQDPFDLLHFVPYLLNQAAERTSREFEALYKAKYKLLRTEWRVLFHLGSYGELTASDICARARLHKTKVSRAVHALHVKRYITRTTLPDDRRQEMLALTRAGAATFQDLAAEAERFNAALIADFAPADRQKLQQLLTQLAKL